MKCPVCHFDDIEYNQDKEDYQKLEWEEIEVTYEKTVYTYYYHSETVCKTLYECPQCKVIRGY